MDWLDLLGKLFVGVVIAVTSSWLTVFLSLRRFYSEKSWEKRADAYTKTLEALHHLRNQAAHERDYARRSLELPKEGGQMLAEAVQTATGELHKQRDMGTFLLSEGAVAALDTLMGQLDEALETGLSGDHFGYLEQRIKAVDCCLAEVRAEAKADLMFPRRRSERRCRGR